MSDADLRGSTTSAETLRRGHTARARSAYDRAVAACRHAGIGQDDAEIVPTGAIGRAANALRLSADSLAAFAKSLPDPAADARCARNAAATAAPAARLARTRDGDAGNGDVDARNGDRGTHNVDRAGDAHDREGWIPSVAVAE